MQSIQSKAPSFRNLYAFGKKQTIDLSLSENPLGCSPLVSEFIKTSNFDVSEYPDPNLISLRGVIAQKNNLTVENIFVGNGSEFILSALPKIVGKGTALIPELTFPMFEIVSKLADLEVTKISMNQNLGINLRKMKAANNENIKLIFLCNPNNPTGKIISNKAILNIVRSTKALVVVDEANIEFGGKTVVNEVKNFSNLVVLRTFSKGFGLAGIRMGFCAADSSIIRKLEQVSQPFPVTGFSVEVAKVALTDEKFNKKTKLFMRKERIFLSNELRNRGFSVVKSEANNLFVKVDRFAKNSTEFVKRLEEKEISVVDGASFGFSQFIRVSPRLREINMAFIDAIDDILN